MTLEERLLHVKEAKAKLGTRFRWICDSMTNGVKHALGNRPNSEFVIDPEGRIVRKRSWSDPRALRSDLEELVGPVERPTRVEELDLPGGALGSGFAGAQRGVVERIDRPRGLVPLKIRPVSSKLADPFYIKLRAEMPRSSLDGGPAKLYLGFHLDPIHGVHWNNLAAPLEFSVSTGDGPVVKPASGVAPKVDVEADLDPREFLVSVDASGATRPTFRVTARYFACSDAEGWCRPVTNVFEVTLERDPDGGSAMRRGRRRPGGPRDARSLVERFDRDGDGRVALGELPAPLARRYAEGDRDGDGSLSIVELEQLLRGSRSRGGEQRRRRARF